MRDLVYLLGGYNKGGDVTNSLYYCPLNTFLSSTGSKSLIGHVLSTLWNRSPWNSVADLPVKGSTAVSLHGRLLAIGGKDSEGEPATAVYMYQPTTDSGSWEIISHMTTPRHWCLAVVLPGNQLMVVGGWTTGDKKCDSVEFGKVI